METMIAPSEANKIGSTVSSDLNTHSNSCSKKPPIPPRRLLVRKSKTNLGSSPVSSVKDNQSSSDGLGSLEQVGTVVNIWSQSHESLISFHFSLLPFFESKDDSDIWLMYQSDKSHDHIKWPSYSKSPRKKDEMMRMREEYEKSRFSSLDAMFVKAIFPFIEKRIDEEGIWRKSGNLNRIKKLQRELQSIIATPEKLKEPKCQLQRRRSSLSRGSKSSFKSSNCRLQTEGSNCRLEAESSFVGSVKSVRSFDSLSSNTSLDEIDEEKTYSVHDMTLLVKRILIPVFQKSPETLGFFKLVDHLSLRIPKEVVDVSLGRDQLIRDSDPRLYANFVSCLSLFLFFHLKLRHSMYESTRKEKTNESTRKEKTNESTKKEKTNESTKKDDSEQQSVLKTQSNDLDPLSGSQSPSAMSLLCSLFDLLSKTASHSVCNKMIPSSLATLFLPLFYPSSLSMTAVSSSTDRLVVDNEQDVINRRLTAMISFIINYWTQISSITSLPNTFMTDFKLLQTSTKGVKRKSGQMDESAMSTCVRFAAPQASSNGNSTIDETQIQLARMYAHVQATQDKKMIKKLNRAGVIIPSKKKDSGKILLPSNGFNNLTTPSSSSAVTPPSSVTSSSSVTSPKECPRTEPKKLKGFKALLAGSPFVRGALSTTKKRKERRDHEQTSPSSYDFSTGNSLG